VVSLAVSGFNAVVKRKCAMLANLNSLDANLAVGLIISVLAFRLGGLAGHPEYRIPVASQAECSR